MDEKGTRRQIVDSAYEAVTVYGITRLSLADVAKRAHLSRQTLYRYFPSKDSLLEAVVEREEERFREQILEAVAKADGPREAFEAAIVAILEGLRTHPLIERLLETEPETLVPYLTVGSFPGLTTQGRLGRLLHHLLPDLADEDVRRTADMLSRLIASYVLDPFDDPPEAFAAWFSQLVFTGVHPAPVGT